MDSNEQAIEQAQDQYRLLYQSMSADPWGWNLYAVAGGVALCRAHETGNLLVQNVHGMSERQMVNQMRKSLNKRTPTAWLGNVVQVMDQGRELCCLYLERVKIGHLHRTAYANDRYSRRLLVFEDTVENITIPTRRVLEIEV